MANEPTIRILVALDSVEHLILFKAIIQRLGWVGLYVVNAVHLIDVVNKLVGSNLNINAIVTNIKFSTGPELTGITAIREIRKVFPVVPVFVTTDMVSSMIREEVRRVNAEWLPQPLDIVAVCERLVEVVNEKNTNGPTGDESSYPRGSKTDAKIAIPEKLAETLRDAERGTNK